MSIKEEVYNMKEAYLEERGENPNTLFLPRNKEDQLVSEEPIMPREAGLSELLPYSQGMNIVLDASQFMVATIHGQWKYDGTDNVYSATLLDSNGDSVGPVQYRIDLHDKYEHEKKFGELTDEEIEGVVARALCALHKKRKDGS